MKRLLLFGSTGSIGRNSLDIVSANPELLKVDLLSCHSNVDLLISQALTHEVKAVHIIDAIHLPKLKAALPDSVRIYSGPDAYAEIIAESHADLVVNAIVGAAGLELSYHTVAAGKTLALANKESLVAGGELLTTTRRRTGADILPIDSEHSAIWQCLRTGAPQEVEKVILTASGGPFRTWSRDALANAGPADALKHPNWSMGEKITIDSATMMNKGLEVIEAVHLFEVNPNQVEIVVHPESIIHSLVQFVDGSQIAQLSPPDMRLPIAYALFYPERKTTTLPRTDLPALGKITFESPDREKFPCIALAYKALDLGGVAPLVLNAANEIAVQTFLAGELKFADVPKVIEKMLSRIALQAEQTLDSLLQADREVRIKTRELIAEELRSSGDV